MALKRKVGRPPLTAQEKLDRAADQRTFKKRCPEHRRRVQTPDAKTRQRIANQLHQLALEREKVDQNSSRSSFWRECESKFGIPAPMLQRIASSRESEKLKKWLALNEHQGDPRGRKRFWKHFASKDTGCRFAKDGSKKKTFVSFFAAEESKLKLWARHEEQQGHALSVEDLVDEFKLILACQVWELEEQQEMHGSLPQAAAKTLSLCAARISNLDNPKKINI